MFSRSSSSSSLSDDAQRHLLSCLPDDAKVLACASAKVYHTPFHSKADWTYSGLAGTLVFGRSDAARGRTLDSAEQSLWFRLVDPAKGVVWIHQVPDALDYGLDKPFFHTFSGKSRRFGFRFDDDAAATALLAQVTSHVRAPGELRRPAPPTARALTPPAGPARRTSRKGAVGQRVAPPQRLAPALVSAPAPGSFVHVAHVGVDTQGELEARNADGWLLMLGGAEKAAGDGAPRAEKRKRSLVPRRPTFKFS
ncbi:Wiskott-Aldrich syndrome protein -like protein [Phanerochaete sordida]|uniref:Wiskott-Aldrich syndrome protein -like protein n=1 Tax=Phanerochaete sordida TaxID=48140 RepID=A0A9P3G157_9APHY|nr:Wiskott-Aldrich syndrome protein -like protein [Phanerochaete sordida]